MNLNFGLLLSSLTTFLLGTFRSILKVNEFTLVGAVLTDSLGRGADKKNGGEPTHSSPKSATFSKEYNSSQHVQLFGPSTCSGTLQRHNHPGRIQYAQGTLRPCNPQATASHCLILVAESVEVPSRGQELNSASLPPFYINPVIFGYKKGVELNAFTYLRPSTARNE